MLKALCPHGHQIEEGEMADEPDYLCRPCHKEFYPSNRYNYYEGEDVTRGRSIVDNRSRSFIWKKDKENHFKEENAVKMIVDNSFKRHYHRRWFLSPWEETDNINSIRYHVLNEGNNCSFLFKNVFNVLIRWNSKLDSKQF
jgi:hypothetical protein